MRLQLDCNMMGVLMMDELCLSAVCRFASSSVATSLALALFLCVCQRCEMVTVVMQEIIAWTQKKCD